MTRQEAIEMLTSEEWLYDEHNFTEDEIAAIRSVCNPWHKASEELPEEKHYKERTLQGIREWSESESVLVIDNHYLKTVDSLKNGEWMKLRTHPRDCDGFPIEYLYWMPIPEIKEN